MSAVEQEGQDYGYGDAAPDCDYGYGDAAPDDSQDYGYGEAAPDQDYGYGDAAPDNQDYGYGDAAPDNQDYGYGDAAPDYGYGDAAPDQDYGYGDAAPDQDYGYGDAKPDDDAARDYGYGDDAGPSNNKPAAVEQATGDASAQPPRRRGPAKRRCSVTKYSLEQKAATVSDAHSMIDQFRKAQPTAVPAPAPPVVVQQQEQQPEPPEYPTPPPHTISDLSKKSAAMTEATASCAGSCDGSPPPSDNEGEDDVATEMVQHVQHHRVVAHAQPKAKQQPAKTGKPAASAASEQPKVYKKKERDVMKRLRKRLSIF